MATKKPSKGSRTRRTARSRTPLGPATRDRMRDAWNEAVEAVTSAQVRVEVGVKDLLRRNRINTKDAATLLTDVRALADRERKKAARLLRTRFSVLQGRIEKERRGAVKGLDDAVRSALAALNIPSRSEVAALTRKVAELSKQVERAKR